MKDLQENSLRNKTSPFSYIFEFQGDLTMSTNQKLSIIQTSKDNVPRSRIRSNIETHAINRLIFAKGK